MIEEIKKLANSPVIASDNDINNFARVMELSNEQTKILHQSKATIKKYYLNQKLDESDRKIIENALAIVSPETSDTSEDLTNESTTKEVNEAYSQENIKSPPSTLSLKAAQLFKELDMDIHTDIFENIPIVNMMTPLKNFIDDENISYLCKIITVANLYKNVQIDRYTILNLKAGIALWNPKDVLMIYEILYNDNKEVIDDIELFTMLIEGGRPFNNITLARSFAETIATNFTILESIIWVASYIDFEDDISLIWYFTSHLPSHSRRDVLFIYKLLFNDNNKHLGEFSYFGNYIDPKLNKILNITKKHKSNNIYINPDIPQDKRQNFKNSINYNIEKVILTFIDFTAWGKGDKALAITEEGMYYNSPGSVFSNDKYSLLITWQDFFSSSICREECYIFIGRNIITCDWSDETYFLLKELHTLGPSHHMAEVKEVIKSKPDIDLKMALQHPYQTLGELIAKTFLYASPAHALYSHLIQNTLEKTEDDIFLNRIYSLSNKYELEKIIMDAENTFLNLLMASIKSNREDITEIVSSDIGRVFTYTENDINGLKREIQNYRNVVFPKINEIYNSSQQLKHFSAQSSDNRSGLKMAAGKVMVGTASMVAGNPMGAVAFFGAAKDIQNDNKQKTRKKSQEELLLEDWGGVYSILYGLYLEEYYNNFKALSYKIAGQYITNYKQSEQVTTQHDKTEEYKMYVKSELTNMVENKEYILMRNKLNSIEEMQKQLKEG